jgi:multidrug efflux pump subunit AcrB
VLNGAKRRLRPIFLTTVTTILGLLPMAIGIGGKSVVWMPMAGTIVWGVGVATFLILLVVPPLYLAAEDLRSLVFRRRSKVLAASNAPQGADERVHEVS